MAYSLKDLWFESFSFSSYNFSAEVIKELTLSLEMLSSLKIFDSLSTWLTAVSASSTNLTLVDVLICSRISSELRIKAFLSRLSFYSCPEIKITGVDVKAAQVRITNINNLIFI